MISPSLLRKGLVALTILIAALSLKADPTVTNVRANQRPGTKLVDIYYDVTGTTSPVSVGLQVSENGGSNFTVPATALNGDTGFSVNPGRGKHIIWSAETDWNLKVTDAMKFRVTIGAIAPDGFALIPAGNFQMGDQSNPLVGTSDELPVHLVYVSAFYMAKYETTKAQWDEVRAWGLNNGYTDLPVGVGRAANHPVVGINWYAMVKWCNARSQKDGLTHCYTVSGAAYKAGSSTPTCDWNANGYRLPTEAEWEKAARGGSVGQNFPWGNTITHSHANYYSSSSYSYDISPTRGLHPTYNDGTGVKTSPVGSFAPNSYGLHDMVGNVWELCWDWYGSNYFASSTASDPLGPASTGGRVQRGGSYNVNAYHCRVANREYTFQSSSSGYDGFRTVRR